MNKYNDVLCIIGFIASLFIVLFLIIASINLLIDISNRVEHWKKLEKLYQKENKNNEPS